MTSRRGGWSPRGRAIVSSCSCHPADGLRPHSTDGRASPPASSGMAPRGESSFRLRGVKMRAQRPGPTAILSTESTSGERSRTRWPDESLCRPRSPPRPGGSDTRPPSSLRCRRNHALSPRRRRSHAPELPTSCRVQEVHCTRDFCIKTQRRDGTVIYCIVARSSHEAVTALSGAGDLSLQRPVFVQSRA